MQSEDFFQRYEDIIDGIVAHNYAIVEGLFEAEVLYGMKMEMLRLLGDDEFHRAGIGNQFAMQQEREIRSDKIHWIENDSANLFESEFVKRVDGFSSYLNQTCYTGIRDWEFHYACFEKGNFYKRHLDRFKNDESRKFSVVTYLNDDWSEEDGGQLVLYLPQGDVTVVPKWGTTVVFKSDVIEHEVMPARRNRYSVTGWLK